MKIDKILISIALLLFAGNVFAAQLDTAALSGKPEKITPVAADYVVGLDSQAGGAVKRIPAGKLPVSEAVQASLDLKPNSSSFVDFPTYVTTNPTAASASGWYVNRTTGHVFVVDNSGIEEITGTYTPFDVTPPAFGFNAVTNAPAGQSYWSTPYTLAGVDRGSTFTTTLPYRIEGGAEVAAAASPVALKLGQTLELKATASSTAGAVVSGTATVGGVTSDPPFSITTESSVTLVIDDNFATDTVANYTNIISAVPSVSQGTLGISGGAAHGSTAWQTTVAYHETPTGSNDHWVRGTCTAGVSDNACLILGSNGTQYYFVEMVGGSLYIRSNDVDYSASYVGGYTAGSTHDVAVQIATDGSAHAVFTAFVDGSQVTLGNATDLGNNVVRGQYIGVRIKRGTSNTDYSVDNLKANSGVYVP